MKHRKNFLFVALITGMAMLIIASCSDKMYVNRAITWAENNERLDTALKSVKKATNLEDTKNWAKTYYAQGYVYKKIYESKDKNFKNLVEEPLVKSFESYKKAYELDEEENFKGPMDKAMFDLHKYFINEGVSAFKKSNYEGALRNFKYTLKVSDMPVFENRLDTAIMFNAGIAAQNMKNWDTAAKYYGMAAKHGYGGSRAYLFLQNAYFQAGDTAKAVETLKEGFEKYPSNENLIGSLINYYLVDAEQPENALKYIEEAQKSHPNNAQYYSAEGQIYDKMEKYEKAKEQYKKAIELDPKLHMALFNLGVLYYNDGVDLVSKANKTKDDEKYAELREQANEKFEKALPYMERALELKPEDTKVLSTLKTLYYRLRTQKEEYKKRYDEVSEKLKQLQGGADQSESQ